MNFGDNLRALRQKHNLSLEKLANELGVSKAAVWQWENEMSDPDNIRSTNMDKLCQFFEVKKEYFTKYKSNFIEENYVEYDPKIKWNDMISRSFKYVLGNATDISNDDKIIASRLLYNKVKSKSIILKSDLEDVLKLLN